ncbi:MAG: hypothetical protein M1827_004921 [Pycnora praestabilis]|nr:MAG: hypothetical protein M1827_004921 [Pycnora praestabilis]
MKVILTGATGFVGGEVLKQCVHDPNIDCIIVLSRRQLPTAATQSDKIIVIIRNDWLNYDDMVMQQLAGASGCFWTLGGKAEDFSSVAEASTVGIDYTLAAANAFATKLASHGVERGKFGFIYCSGMFAEMDQGKSLWFERENRKIKAGRSTSKRPYSVRPGGVLPKVPGSMEAVVGKIVPSVRVDKLATVMIDIYMLGADERVLENSQIKRRARKIEKRRKKDYPGFKGNDVSTEI